ncbi:hypothetical protein [Lysobacter humi (ex Lee et al. 2017)]
MDTSQASTPNEPDDGGKGRQPDSSVGLTSIPANVLAAKTAFWTSLLTANALVTAGVVAWAFAPQNPPGLAGFLMAAASLIGIFLPLALLAGVADVELQIAGIKAKRARWLPSWKLWHVSEILATICVIVNLLAVFVHFAIAYAN